MALDALFRIGDEGALFVVGVDADGRPKGFLHFAISHACAALSLSTMPRLPDVPNGFNEWLICASIEWARDNGYRTRVAQLLPVRRAARARTPSSRARSASRRRRCAR